MDKLFVQTAAGFDLECMPDLQQYVYMYFERNNYIEVHLKAYTQNIWKKQLGEEDAYKKIGTFFLDEDSNTTNFQITLFLLPRGKKTTGINDDWNGLSYMAVSGRRADIYKLINETEDIEPDVKICTIIQVNQ